MWPSPSPRLLWLLALAALPAALHGVSPLFGALALGLDLALVALFLFDAARARGEGPPTARRALARWATRGRPFSLTLEVRSPTDRPLEVTAAQRLPETFAPRELEASLALPPGGQAEQLASPVAQRRGRYLLPAPVLRWQTPLRLGVLHASAGEPVPLAVLPDLTLLARFDALARQRRLHELGLARVRERGEGTEIAGLRPYVRGDPFSRIDWKATARRTSMVSREMHGERRQNLLLLLDCGRRMAREAAGRSRLDHAVEAALMLAHVALRTDDRVGLMAFADQVLRVVPLVYGQNNGPALARAVHALEPVMREPPYEKIATQVAARFSRRSLAVLFTDAIEPASFEALLKPVAFLRRKHLLLCVVFRDEAIDAALDEVPADAHGLYRAGAAAELSLERERALRRLRQAGALVLEAPAERLSTAVVNRYLEVKARHLL